MDTVEHSLMRMFREGPEVSLKGSPTVSPTTAALWHSEPLAPVMAGFDVLLGVVPGTAGVGHEHGHGKAGDGDAAQQARHTDGAQDQAGEDGDDDGQQGGLHHLPQSALGAQGHAGGVVGVCLVLHDARDLLELAADLHHDGLGRLLHRAHGEGGEDEGQHGADEHAHQHRGAGQGEVQHLLRVLLDDVHVADQQGQGCQGGGADGEALAGGGGGVAQRVQCVGPLPDALRQAAHLRDAAGVICHGAVGVRSQGDAQGGQHTHAGDADAVQALVEGRSKGAGLIHDLHAAAGGEVADQHRSRHDQDGGQSGLQTQGDAADDDGGGAGLGGGRQLLSGLIGIRGVILGEVADGAAADQTAEDGHINAHVPIQNEIGQGRRQDGGENSGGVSAGPQALQQGLLGGVLLSLHQEGADDGADDAAHGQGHGQQQAAPAVAAHSAQGEGCQDRAHIALIQVRAHAGHIAHVVAHVVGDGGGVPGDRPRGFRPQLCPPGRRPRRRPWCRCRRPHGRTEP